MVLLLYIVFPLWTPPRGRLPLSFLFSLSTSQYLFHSLLFSILHTILLMSFHPSVSPSSRPPYRCRHYQVSLLGFLFLTGLYVSSISSSMGGLYGAPRILQSIAEQKVIRIMDILATGVGSSVAGLLLTLRSGVVMWCGMRRALYRCSRYTLAVWCIYISMEAFVVVFALRQRNYSELMGKEKI